MSIRIKKMLLLIALVVMFSVLFSTSINASILVKNEEEAKTAYNQYVEYMANNANSEDGGKYYPILINGTELNPNEVIDVEYQNEAQKELFDYTFVNGVITVKIKDLDVYNAIINNKNKLISTDNPVYEKLAKYCNEENEFIGLKVKMYFPNNITKIVGIFNLDDYAALGNTVYKTTDDYAIGKDAKGIYAENVYAGTLAHFWDNKFNMGARNLGLSFYTWNVGEFIIQGLSDNEEKIYLDENQNDYVETCTTYTRLKMRLELAETAISDEVTGISAVTKKGSDSKFVVASLDAENADYKELAAKLSKYDILGAYEIKLDGSHEGTIKLTFPIDSKYNGNDAIVLHKKSDGTIDNFDCKVENGKITLNVTELSPFMIAIPKREIDAGEPKTGVEDYVPFAITLTLMCACGLVTIIKKY